MLIGSNLKMYFSHARTVDWTRQVAASTAKFTAAGGLRTFVLPQGPSIPACVELAADTGLLVGAQDLAAAEEGAYTGEVAGGVLAELGCSLVLVGHAERRARFGETDDVVAHKVAAARRAGLVPIICVGETERVSAADAATECGRQIAAALAIADAQGLAGESVIAYEPLWAIGAPEPAGTDHIRAVCSSLREALADSGENAPVIYGGSAGPGLLTRIADSVDGLFLGRFAHDPAAFDDVLDEAAQLAAAQATKG